MYTTTFNVVYVFILHMYIVRAFILNKSLTNCSSLALSLLPHLLAPCAFVLALALVFFSFLHAQPPPNHVDLAPCTQLFMGYVEIEKRVCIWMYLRAYE